MSYTIIAILLTVLWLGKHITGSIATECKSDTVGEFVALMGVIVCYWGFWILLGYGGLKALGAVA